jgi:hypothetical protein
LRRSQLTPHRHTHRSHAIGSRAQSRRSRTPWDRGSRRRSIGDVADRAHRDAATRDPIVAAASVWLISNVPLPKAIRAPILRYIADAFMLEFPA